MRTKINKEIMDIFSYLTDWLVSAIKPEYDKSEIKKYAEKGNKPLAGIVAALWKLFDTHICEGKEKMFRTKGKGKDMTLYAFNERWFEEVDGEAFLKELVRRVLTAIEVSPAYQFYAPVKIAKELLGKISHSPECVYEPNRRYICFTNGVLDLQESKSKRFKPFSIDRITDIILDFPYDERATSMLWRVKLGDKKQGIIPNTGLCADFQQFCGSLLADRTKYKKEYVCYLYGGGGNGKSVLAAAIANVFGERYYSTFSLQQIFTKQTNGMFVAKEMDGKLLNWCDDVDEKDVSGGEFKRFVSGESIPGRKPFGVDFTKIRPPMLLCCINTFPDVKDNSDGNHRRQLIIETTKKQWEAAERDTELAAKLSTTESRQAIFNWILEGYDKFVRNGGDIKLSEDSKMARATRLALSNPMRRWAYERNFTIAAPKDDSDPRWRRLVDWYADYKAYCEENGCNNPENSRKVAEMFRSMGFREKRASQGTMFCVGVKAHDTDENGGYIDPVLRKMENEARESGNIL